MLKIKVCQLVDIKYMKAEYMKWNNPDWYEEHKARQIAREIEKGKRYGDGMRITNYKKVPIEIQLANFRKKKLLQKLDYLKKHDIRKL